MPSAPRRSADVVLIHAYSARNVGDGLLVQLSESLIKEALPGARVTVVATEADTFDRSDVTQWRPPGLPRLVHHPVAKRIGFLLTIFVGPHRQIRNLVANADVVVAVGGGYLRGDSASASIKSLGAHFGQLRLAARYGHRTVYLPQSIGPFPQVYRRLVTSRLRRISRVFVRDNRSDALCDPVPTARRAPDLAVIELADKFSEVDTSSVSPSRLTVVARELPRPRTYDGLLSRLAADERTEFAVQSSIGGNDDREISARFGGANPRALREVLADGEPHVVISTRLHGSMAALLAGHPSIHLSYERKGWGAFEDLGLDEYVLNARDATADQVFHLTHKILDDPAAYWSRCGSRLDYIRDHRLALVHAIRDARGYR